MDSIRIIQPLALPPFTPSTPQPLDPYDLSLGSLAAFSHWIRDILDPLVAREGGAVALSSEQVLKLRAFLHNLRHGSGSAMDVLASSPTNTPSQKLKARPTLTLPGIYYQPPRPGVIAESRIHLALDVIRGKATRWPDSLADEADGVLLKWERENGTLLPHGLPPPLWDDERGGRLHGVCAGTDTHSSRVRSLTHMDVLLMSQALFRRFAQTSPVLVDDSRAYRRGSLGFRAGTWWLGTMFAFREGIIDSASIKGGIVADDRDAYALVLNGRDEASPAYFDGPGDTPEHFTFICRDAAEMPAIWRLTASGQARRSPEERGIRILRTHGSGGFWSPSAGVRYDGMYIVTHYSAKRIPLFPAPHLLDDDETRFEFFVHFSRVNEPAEVLGDVFSRPWAEDLDDYGRYNAMAVRAKAQFQKQAARLKAKVRATNLTSRSGTFLSRAATSGGRKKLIKLLGEEVGSPGWSTQSKGEPHHFDNTANTAYEGSEGVGEATTHSIPLSDKGDDDIWLGLNYRSSTFRSNAPKRSHSQYPSTRADRMQGTSFLHQRAEHHSRAQPDASSSSLVNSTAKSHKILGINLAPTASRLGWTRSHRDMLSDTSTFGQASDDVLAATGRAPGGFLNLLGK